MKPVGKSENKSRRTGWSGLELVVVVLILYTSIYRFFRWDVILGFLNYRIPLLIDRLGFSQAEFHIDSFWINPWITRLVILVAGCLFVFSQWKSLCKHSFWLAFLPLVVLLALTGASRFWSVAEGFTVGRFELLLAEVLGGLWIGSRYKISAIRTILETFVVVLAIGSLLVIFLYPEYAVVRDFRGFDQWNGIFGWKMPFGLLMGFTVILFLFRLLDFKGLNWKRRVSSLVLYGLGWVLLVKSQSATELLGVIAVHFVILLGGLYLIWGHVLRRVHWWLLAGIMVIGILMAWFERDLLLGLVGREVTFTGRLPLWASLEPAIRERIFFGYGFGEAFWKNEVYYLPIWKLNTWQPVFAHNGYFEALLDNGLLGLVLWIIFLFQVGSLGLRYFVRNRNLVAMFFFSWLIFIVVMNVGNNHLGSYETFTILLLAISLGFLVQAKLDSNKVICPMPLLQDLNS
jgi:exopolysaccharide production protein ExoQ